MTTPKPDAKMGEGVLSRKRWKMALAMQRNANVPSAEANEDAAALDAHDLALRAQLAAAEARAEKLQDEADREWNGPYADLLIRKQDDEKKLTARITQLEAELAEAQRTFRCVEESEQYLKLLRERDEARALLKQTEAWASEQVATAVATLATERQRAERAEQSSRDWESAAKAWVRLRESARLRADLTEKDLRARLNAAVEALRWLANVSCGVGKSGEPPQDDEINDCHREAREIIAAQEEARGEESKNWDVAQLAEQRPVKSQVEGSSPSIPATPASRSGSASVSKTESDGSIPSAGASLDPSPPAPEGPHTRIGPHPTTGEVLTYGSNYTRSDVQPPAPEAVKLEDWRCRGCGSPGGYCVHGCPGYAIPDEPAPPKTECKHPFCATNAATGARFCCHCGETIVNCPMCGFAWSCHKPSPVGGSVCPTPEPSRAELVAALRWLAHLGHGIGKSGEDPEPGEFEAAMREACAILARIDDSEAK